MSFPSIAGRLSWQQLGPRGQGLAMAALGAIAFSGKAIVAKLMYKMGADAFAVVGLRMALAFPMFLWLAWWSVRAVSKADGHRPRVEPLTARQWWQIAGLGFTGYYLASTLDFLGLQYISASLERAILYLNPTMVLILSAVWLGQRIRPAQLAGVVLAYSGVAMVWFHDWDAAHLVSAQSTHGLEARSAILLGSLLVLGSALSYAIYLMGSGEIVKRLGSMRLVGYASCMACVLCVVQWLVVHAVTGGQMGSVAHLPWEAWALSALNAVTCTVLPVWLLMRAVQLLGASVASQVGMVGPLSTIWMAAWWLNEPVGPRLILGTAAVLAGIVVLTRASRPPMPAPAPVSGNPPVR